MVQIRQAHQPRIKRAISRRSDSGVQAWHDFRLHRDPRKQTGTEDDSRQETKVNDAEARGHDHVRYLHTHKPTETDGDQLIDGLRCWETSQVEQIKW